MTIALKFKEVIKPSINGGFYKHTGSITGNPGFRAVFADATGQEYYVEEGDMGSLDRANAHVVSHEKSCNSAVINTSEYNRALQEMPVHFRL